MAGSGTAHLRPAGEALLRVEHLLVEFPVGNTGLKVNAVSDVSLDLTEGETLGLVGESGCGKSTTGRAIMQIPRPTGGSVVFDGTDLTQVGSEEMRVVRSKMQMIFQDPISSLNPRRTVGQIVGEPLVVRWLESYPKSPVAKAWAQWSRLITRHWPRLWRWARWPLSLVGLAALLWVIGTRVGRPPIDGSKLTGIRSTLAHLTDIAKVPAVPGLIALAPFALAFLASGAIWLGLTAALPFAAIPRSLRLRGDRARFQAEVDAKVREVLNTVGLDPDIAMPKRPHEFSGGQCQRICIARALVLDPKVIICDEPVSALDVSVQAQVLNLLEDLKVRYGLTLVFIAHDLAVVKSISDRVAVMYLGKICEVAGADEIYARPAHPYSSALLNSIPEPDPTINQRGQGKLKGELPSPIAPPSGCRFRTRCPLASERCAAEEPQLTEVEPSHFVACHYPLIGGPAASERGAEVAAG